MTPTLATTLVGLVALAGAAVPPGQAVVQQALGARDSLTQNYHLVLAVTTALPDRYDKQVYTLEVWVKGPLVRTDLTRHENTSDKASVGTRMVVCRNCERTGYGLTTTTGLTSSRSQVSFYPLGDKYFEAVDTFKVDWRRLGQLHGCLTNYARDPADSSLRFVLQVGGEAREVEEDGAVCYALGVPSKTGYGYRCLFGPQVGMNLVKYDDASDNQQFKKSTAVTYSKTAGGVWFPKTITHNRTRAGSEMLREQVVVETAELNTVVPDRVFTLAGIGLDYGQSVAFPEIKNNADYPTWSEGKLDTVNTVGKTAARAYQLKMALAPAKPPVPDVPQSSGRPYYASAAALAAGLIVLARRRAA